MKPILSFLLLFVVTFSSAQYLPGYDSANSNLGGLSKFYQQSEDELTVLLTSARMILNDSAREGIHRMNKLFDDKIASDSLDRMFNYIAYEFSYFLKTLDENNLTAPEQKLGMNFFKSIFTNSFYDFGAELEKAYRKNKNSIFIRRIRIFYMTALGNRVKYEKSIHDVVQMDSALISMILLKAELSYNDGELDESIRNFSKALDLFPQSSFAYLGRGTCYYNQGKYEAAIQDFEKSINYFSKNFIAQYSLAASLQGLERHEEAIRAFHKCNSINSKNDECFSLMGYSFEQLNKSDSADYYYSRAIYLNPRNASYYKKRGDLNYYADNNELALKDYTMALQIEPYNKYYYVDRGNAYYYSDMQEDAFKDFQESLKIDPHYYYALSRIGDYYYYHKKDMENAISFYKKSLKYEPSNKYSLYGLGRCYDELKDFESKIKVLQKAIAIDSTYDSALGSLGWTYYCVDQYDSCIYYSNRAIRFNNEAYYAMFNIALATLRMGRFEESKDLYRKYLALYLITETDEPDGAIQDLQDLLNKKILVDEANYILKNIFNH